MYVLPASLASQADTGLWRGFRPLSLVYKPPKLGGWGSEQLLVHDGLVGYGELDNRTSALS